MKNLHSFISILLLLILPFHFLKAAYLQNVPQTIVQPNGDKISCFASGDEYWHWLHDSKGYTIIQDTNNGFFVYAIEANGILIPSEYRVGHTDPQTTDLKPFANCLNIINLHFC